MYVADIMTTRPVTVRPTDRLSRVAKKITDRHISGVFVTQDDRLLGQISHRDILQKIFPSYEEFYDDLAHSVDFEQIQTRAREMGDLTAADVMTYDIETVSADIHVMKVASWMLLKDIHRLAVVDDEGRLIGVVSRGDVFYKTIEQEMNRPKSKKSPAKASAKTTRASKPAPA